MKCVVHSWGKNRKRCKIRISGETEEEKELISDLVGLVESGELVVETQLQTDGDSGDVCYDQFVIGVEEE